MRLYTKVEEPYDARVYVPYTKVTPKLQHVIDALRVQFVQPEATRIKGKEGYWKLIADLWDRGETFFIVEQDNIVWPGAIDTLNHCKNPWCTLPSLCRGVMVYTSFGTVKFDAAIIERFPDFWKDLPDKQWYWLDSNWATHMIEQDETVCIHWPASTHLNELHWPDNMSKRYEAYKVWKLDVDKEKFTIKLK